MWVEPDVAEELNMLQELIEGGFWSRALDRIRTNPDEIVPNEKLPTALHTACEDGEAPVSLLKALLNRRPDVIKMLDHDEAAPLHYACSGGYALNMEAMQLLLRSYPEAIFLQDKSTESTPLHYFLRRGGPINTEVLRLLLDTANSLSSESNSAKRKADSCTKPSRNKAKTPSRNYESNQSRRSLLLTTDKSGLTPLHIGCFRLAPVTVLEMLLDSKSYSGALTAACIPDRHRRLAIHYAACYGVTLRGMERVLEANRAGVHFRDSYGLKPFYVNYMGIFCSNEDRMLEVSMDGNFLRVSSESLWNKMNLLLKEEYSKFACNWSIVHIAASFPCPPRFLQCALNLFPEQAKTRDTNGNYPLHVVCSRQETKSDAGHFWLPQTINTKSSLYINLEKETYERDNSISMILRANPAAAKARDRQGRLPLHLAAGSGKPWMFGLMDLIRAAPLALMTRDEKEGLYPFMHAAVSEHGTLDLLYNILRAHPPFGLLNINTDSSFEGECPCNTKRQRVEGVRLKVKKLY